MQGGAEGEHPRQSQYGKDMQGRGKGTTQRGGARERRISRGGAEGKNTRGGLGGEG